MTTTERTTDVEPNDATLNADTTTTEADCAELSEVLHRFEQYVSEDYEFRGKSAEFCRTVIRWAFLAGQVKGLSHK